MLSGGGLLTRRRRLASPLAVIGLLAIASCSFSFDPSEFTRGGPGATPALNESDGSAADGTTTPDGGGDVAAAGGDAAPFAFFDDFQRPDGYVLGNGWQEETALPFELSSGAARFVAVNFAQESAKVTRPASEVILDVRASVEVTIPSGTFAEASLIVRAATPVAYGNPGYRVHVTSFAQGALTRMVGLASFDLPFQLSPPLQADQKFRMVVTAVQASGAVQLTASVIRVSDGLVLGALSYVDSGLDRFALPGVVGFTADSCCSMTPGAMFDNFTYGPP